MKNKGFTLIELLAVIVILAIIALIATPIVLGIIEDSRESAKINSAQFMIDGVQTAYAVSYTKSYADDASTSDIDETKLAGELPTLKNIKNERDFKNAVTEITTNEDDEEILVVKTSDGAVTCKFEVETNAEGKEVLASDNCGFTEAQVPKIEVGEISADKAITAPADPEQGA